MSIQGAQVGRDVPRGAGAGPWPVGPAGWPGRLGARASQAMAVLALLAALAVPPRLGAADGAAFADFGRRASAGASLTVVFFGASLTWGANASDPPHTSYRAQLLRRLEAAYPVARFHGEDAAIGGTGSQLGVFRLERDVLARHPDLVFLDFSANDDLTTADEETLAAYESLVRRLVLARVPVVQVIFPFRANLEPAAKPMPRRAAHQAIAAAYGLPSGDAIALVARRVAEGACTLAEIWPYDGVHPGDRGYALFAEAAWAAFRQGLDDAMICQAPRAMLHADTYLAWARVRLATLAPLPPGWRADHADLTSAYFDMLMSRWLDGLVVAAAVAAPAAAPVAPFTCAVHGRMLLLFGESTEASGSYRVLIDGVPCIPPGRAVAEIDAGAFARAARGNVHHVVVVATALDPARSHRLEIVPLLAPGQELRLESIGVAGAPALVAP